MPNYPSSLDTGGTLGDTRLTGDVIPASDHNYLADLTIALETKLGIGAATPTTVGQVLTVTGAGATGYQGIPTSFTKTVGPSNADYITTGASSGTTDDSQIQAACAAVIAAGGGTVYIQPKSTPYNITRRIIILGSNLIVRGGGQGATTLKLANEVNQEIVVVGNGNNNDTGAGDAGGGVGTPCNDVWFMDMTLDGYKTNQTAGSLYSGSATRNLLRFRSDAQTSYGGGCIRVKAISGKQNGLSCESQAGGGFYFCRAEKCDQNGMWCENTSNWDMSHNFTRNNGEDLAIGGSGIRAVAASAITIIGNDCKGDLGGGISVAGISSSTIANNLIYRAGWEGGTTNPANGLYGNGSSLVITGNSIYGSYGNGMQFNDIQYSTVANNTFRRNGQQTDNTYSDIYITFVGGGSIHNNVFANNTFQNDTATFYLNKVAYNISSNAPAAHGANTFIGNKFGLPGTATVYNMLQFNTWGEGHTGVNPVGTYNYGYFGSSTQTIDPKLGSVLQGTGYLSSVAVTIADGIMVGQRFIFQYSQDTGGKQLTWAANVLFSGGVAPVFNGKSNTFDLLTFTWDGTNWLGTTTNFNTFYSYGYLSNPQTISPDNGKVQSGTCYNGVTTVNFTGGRHAGQQFTLILGQDVGNKTITWPSNVRWPGDAAPVLSTAPYTTDIMTFTWDGTYWNGSISEHGGNKSIYGSLTANATPTAAGPTVAVNGTAGTTTYGYKIVAINSDSLDGIPSTAGTVTTGNATLTGVNYNAISWNVTPGAYGYKILQSISAGAYNYLTTVYTNGYQDNGSATGSVYTPITVNPGGNLTLGGKLSITAGTNKTVGTGTLVAATLTIANTAVTASSLIFLTKTSASTGVLSVGTVTAGTSFVVNSSLVGDTATFNWWILN